MVCRHGPEDPQCSSYARRQSYLAAEALKRAEEIQAAAEELAELRALEMSPRADDFEIVRVEEVEGCLVMEAQYPSCSSCSFDARKIMVFENENLLSAIHWRFIDPHFHEATKLDKKVAPSPIARFPASAQGWTDALNFARMKGRDSREALTSARPVVK